MATALERKRKPWKFITMKQIHHYNDIRRADSDEEDDLFRNSQERLHFNKWFRAKKSGAFSLIHELNMSILSKVIQH